MGIAAHPATSNYRKQKASEENKEEDRNLYNSYFGFIYKPFKPEDPKGLYRNPNFNDACAAILNGIRKRRGFILLTGDAGIGKTSVLNRCVADADDIFFISVVYTKLSFPDLLRQICEHLGLQVFDRDIDEQSQLLLDDLADRASRNQAVALLIDDAQNMPTDTLLHLQALVETPMVRLQRLQVVFAGLPEFASRLDQAELQELRDNIPVRYQLKRLSPIQTKLFINQQLKVAGYEGEELLSRRVLERLDSYCKGIPRAIAMLCDAIFSFASTRSTRDITPELVDEAAKYCFLGELSSLAAPIGGLRVDGIAKAPSLPTAGTSQSGDLTLNLTDTPTDEPHQADHQEITQSEPDPSRATLWESESDEVTQSPRSDPLFRNVDDWLTAGDDLEQQQAQPHEEDDLQQSQQLSRDTADQPPADDDLEQKDQQHREDEDPQQSQPLSHDHTDRIHNNDKPTSEDQDSQAVDISVDLHPSPEDHTWLSRILYSSLEQEKPMSRLDQMNKILKNIQNESPGVEASALISEDGLMIASALSQDLDETRVAGMTATLLNLGTRAATELRRGDVQEVIVRGDHGYAVMISAGRGALLLTLANESAKLGLIFFDMREAIKAIRNVL